MLRLTSLSTYISLVEVPTVKLLTTEALLVVEAVRLTPLIAREAEELFIMEEKSSFGTKCFIPPRERLSESTENSSAAATDLLFE